MLAEYALPLIRCTQSPLLLRVAELRECLVLQRKVGLLLVGSSVGLSGSHSAVEELLTLLLLDILCLLILDINDFLTIQWGYPLRGI